MNNKQKDDLALIFWKKRAVKFRKKGFKFNLHNEHPDAPLSPNYMNLRDVFRNARIRNTIAAHFLPVIKKLKPDRLVDLPQSVSPLVATLSDLTGINMISIRFEALKTTNGKRGEKTHGINNPIMGKFRRGQKVLIIDDVVASLAHTKEKAIEFLRGAGLKVILLICVVVDREEGGKETLRRKRFKLFCVLKFKEMLQLYFDRGLITEDYYKRSLKYSQIAKKYALKV